MSPTRTRGPISVGSADQVTSTTAWPARCSPARRHRFRAPPCSTWGPAPELRRGRPAALARPSVVAVDAAIGMLGVGAAARPPAVAGDARSLPFRSAGFDLGVAAFSLNHLSDPVVALVEFATGGRYRVARSSCRVTPTTTRIPSSKRSRQGSRRRAGRRPTGTGWSVTRPCPASRPSPRSRRPWPWHRWNRCR